MKIEKRLRLNSWIYIFAIMLMMLSLSWAFWSFDKNSRNLKLAEGMQNAAFERIVLRDDYLLNREERASIQWQAKSEALRGLIETAAEMFTNKEDKALLQKARQDFDATLVGFSAILEKDKQERRKANKILAFDEAAARHIGQIFLKGYTLMDSIGILHESTARAAIRARNIAAFLVIFFFVFGGFMVFINSNLINRIMIKRLAALTLGIKAIGDGNLDYHIVADTDDELADLARASNKMVDKLKESYTSLENLRTEIALRNQAESDKRVSEQKFHLLFEEMMSGCAVHEIICDENGKPVDYRFLSVNTAFEKMTGFKSADIVGRTVLEVLPATESIWIERYGQVTLTRESAYFENYAAELSKYFEVRVFSPSPGVFATIFNDITDRKLAEEEIKRLSEEMEQRIIERTAELINKTAELERINNVFVDRELRMRELKARIAELEKQKT